MLTIENIETYGWEAAIRGMRNPMNSWDKSDTRFYDDENFWELGKGDGPCIDLALGPNDEQLMRTLINGGPVHAKFRRMINITMDIMAPLYWWKEFDTYKIGTVANSCSTMHKIQAKAFTTDDFSCEHLFDGKDFDYSEIDLSRFGGVDQAIEKAYQSGACNAFHYYDPDACDREGLIGWIDTEFAMDVLNRTIDALNHYRSKFIKTNNKRYWWQMIQLLPSSYNQKRTVQLNYEVAAHIYPDRKDHKLDEWHVLCDEFEKLPYGWLITRKNKEEHDFE